MFAYINLESIFIKTKRQSIFVMCEEFDIWLRDLADENEVKLGRTEMSMIRWLKERKKKQN